MRRSIALTLAAAIALQACATATPTDYLEACRARGPVPVALGQPHLGMETVEQCAQRSADDANAQANNQGNAIAGGIALFVLGALALAASGPHYYPGPVYRSVHTHRTVIIRR